MGLIRNINDDISRIDSIEITANEAKSIAETAEIADPTILKNIDIGVAILAPNGDGSQLTGIDRLPSRISKNGKYLKTDGTTEEWEDLDLGTLISSTTIESGEIQISNIVAISQTDYDSIAFPIDTTMYIIVD